MIIDKITEMGDNLKLLEGHDRLQYLVDKANEAYDEHGWGVEMLQFLYEMKKV